MRKVRPFKALLLDNKARFLTLMISLLLLFVIYPFLSHFRIASIILDVFFTIILLSGVFALSENKRLLRFAVLLAILTIITSWSNELIKNSLLTLLSLCFYLLFFILTAISILIYVLRDEEVTKEKIFGAVSVYIMIGIIWAMIYGILEIFTPGSFSINIQSAAARATDFTHGGLEFLFYYSFVTLTTLGYGDITPASAPAQTFSALEAMIGQLYLAVMIARLVGLHIAYSKFGVQKIENSNERRGTNAR